MASIGQRSQTPQCPSGQTYSASLGRCASQEEAYQYSGASEYVNPRSGSASGTQQSTYQPETNTFSPPTPVTTITSPLQPGRMTTEDQNAFWASAEGQRSVAAMRAAQGLPPSNEVRQQAANLQNTPKPAPSTAGAEAVKSNPLPGAVAPPSAQAGTDAALLRAKERQGQIGRSALTGLREALGERGALGSGLEAGATADVTQASLAGLTDINREQLIQEDDIARRFAELSYTGGIQQRGQDLTARGQNINALMMDSSASQSAQSEWMRQQQALLEALRSLQY